jgi:hypothetical protein
MRARIGFSVAVFLSVLLVCAWFLPPLTARSVSADTTGRIVPTGNTVQPRFDHTATLLPNGKVLIAAGLARNGVIEPTAELYDPHTGSFVSAGAMRSPRGWGVTAILLRSGKVLFVGGGNGSECDATCSSAELYDPSSGVFTSIGNMTTQRAGANAVLLRNGDVLIVGGDAASVGDHAASAELYRPSTGTFSATGSMHSNGASVLVPQKNGKVLAVNDSGAELYDPATGVFTMAGNFRIGRQKYGAAALPDGRLLIAGGQIGGAWGPKSATTNIYDPATGAFTSGPEMSFTRFKLRKAVAPLGDGRILIAGGAEQPEIYDAASNSFHPAMGSHLDSFYFSTATRLSNGEVLIVGGYARPGGSAVNHAWLYLP